MSQEAISIERRIVDSFARQGLMQTFGARVIRVAPGEVDIALEYAAHLTQQHGFIHGAVVAAIGDTACGYSALTLMPEGSEVVSVEYKINFLAPATGTRFLARGKTIRAGRTLSVCQGDVFTVEDDREKQVAAVLATMMRVDAQPALI